MGGGSLLIRKGNKREEQGGSAKTPAKYRKYGGRVQMGWVAQESCYSSKL